MDAISFVLGVKSAQLRSTQLKDLVYRGRKLAGAAGQKRKADDDEEDDGDQDENENDAKTAYVMAVYQDENGKEFRFKRM
jgi:structural maintenance of chromosome 1